MKKKIYSIALLLIALNIPAQAQELNAQVKILSTAIANADKQIFTTMEKSITDFFNTRKWTKDEFATNEKINMNVLINLTSKTSEGDVYTGTLTIQASRPVYNTSYTSPTINFLDKDLVFRYTQFTPMQFNENRVTGSDAIASNLTAVLAYYAYLVIGLDYESFSKNGGTEYFKKAQFIVNNAPEEGKTIPGWKAVENNRNRYWLIDQILNPRFSAVREVWYTIHREGLDNMYASPETAQKTILGTIETLKKVNRENPGSILLQFFFNAKSDEYAKTVSQLPVQERAPYASALGQIDVTNIRKYQDLNRE